VGLLGQVASSTAAATAATSTAAISQRKRPPRSARPTAGAAAALTSAVPRARATPWARPRIAKRTAVSRPFCRGPFGASEHCAPPSLSSPLSLHTHLTRARTITPPTFIFPRAPPGGKRCAEPNCPKGAEGATAKCVAHGGGKRCDAEGCAKLARGPSGCCRAHGGGQRCDQPGCEKNAVGPLKRCVSHGKRSAWPTQNPTRTKKHRASNKETQSLQ
jgi:hypothetical protein